MDKNFLHNRLYLIRSLADILSRMETLDRFFDLGAMLDRVGADTAEGEQIVNARKNLRRSLTCAGVLAAALVRPEPAGSTPLTHGRNVSA